jgi:hypothetical protein
MLALAKPVDPSAKRPTGVVGDPREDGCHADVQIAIGVTRLVARITRDSAARLADAQQRRRARSGHGSGHPASVFGPRINRGNPMAEARSKQ